MNNIFSFLKRTDKISFTERLTRRMLMQLFLSLFLYTASGIVLYTIAWAIYHRATWYGTELIYIIVQWFDLRMDAIAYLYLIGGYTVIALLFLLRSLSYLREISGAVDQVYRMDDNLIALPEPLKELENRMNQTKLNILTQERIARDAEQRKNDLVTYLAHDLKTPITSIIGYLTLLRDEPQISQELRTKYTGIALDKSERLEDLINEFFDITRFSLSKLSLEPERRNLSRMLEQITNEFEPILKEKELRWNTDISPDIEILCDPEKLNRVFDNLIRNAVNYSYACTEIFLSMKLCGNSVEIWIENHGRTIPPEKLTHIFEQFFRLDSSRASTTGGSGLGLAIAKEITELHGGVIRAESAEESIRFIVRLPVDCQKIV